jgi:uncharacterized membrane protein
VGVGLLIIGVVLVVTGVLAANERLPRNRAWGIRLRSTLRSDKAWREGHRAAAAEMTIIGVSSLVVGALALSVPVVGAVGLLLILGALLHDASVADRAAKAAE